MSGNRLVRSCHRRAPKHEIIPGTSPPVAADCGSHVRTPGPGVDQDWKLDIVAPIDHASFLKLAALSLRLGPAMPTPGRGRKRSLVWGAGKFLVHSVLDSISGLLTQHQVILFGFLESDFFRRLP